MNCPVCSNICASVDSQCPKCGEQLGQWRELESAAESLRDRGLSAAASGDSSRAILYLTEAMVLRPDDASVLQALADVLIAEGVYEEAGYYLQKCMALTECVAQSLYEKASQALARLEGLLKGPVWHAILGLEEIRRENGQAKRLAGIPDAPDGSATASDQAWSALARLEREHSDAIKAMGPVLACAEPVGDGARGACAYARGLVAVATGDRTGAVELFRQSSAADASRMNAEVYLLNLAQTAEEAQSTMDDLLAKGRRVEDVLIAVILTGGILEKRGETCARSRLLEGSRDWVGARGYDLSAAAVAYAGQICCLLGRVQEGRELLQKAMHLDPECAAKEFLALLPAAEPLPEAAGKTSEV